MLDILHHDTRVLKKYIMARLDMWLPDSSRFVTQKFETLCGSLSQLNDHV